MLTKFKNICLNVRIRLNKTVAKQKGSNKNCKQYIGFNAFYFISDFEL